MCMLADLCQPGNPEDSLPIEFYGEHTSTENDQMHRVGNRSISPSFNDAGTGTWRLCKRARCNGVQSNVGITPAFKADCHYPVSKYNVQHDFVGSLVEHSSIHLKDSSGQFAELRWLRFDRLSKDWHMPMCMLANLCQAKSPADSLPIEFCGEHTSTGNDQMHHNGMGNRSISPFLTMQALAPRRLCKRARCNGVQSRMSVLHRQSRRIVITQYLRYTEWPCLLVDWMIIT